jgi:sugar fermentation stimulation protein A
MKYTTIKKAVFLDRPNRFIAHVNIAGQQVTCHVKNTGRCRELLIPGTTVYCEFSPKAERKTHYDLIAVEKKVASGKPLLINIDSQAPNKVVEEWLRSGGLFKKLTFLKPECQHENSRFDFYFETARKKAFLEVKGVTLEKDGVVLFPDAPTERGIKHVLELKKCVQDGFAAYVLFLVQMDKATHFTPNYATHPAFGEALKQAQAAGVKLLAYTCHVTPSTLKLYRPIPIVLSK